MRTALFIWGMGLVLMTSSPTAAFMGGVEVRSLGLSRKGERTELSVLLNRAANPQVSPFTAPGRAQLIVEFPRARLGRLPTRLAGDEVLVKQVRIEPSAAGVKIILEMFPERPYLFSREIRGVASGGALFILGLRAEGRSEPTAPLPEPESAAPPPAPEPPTAPPEARGPQVSVAPTGTFSELYQLIPPARSLLESLRGEGWTVADAKSYDRPGQRYSRAFTLANPRYPEMTVRIAHLPSSAPGAPVINLIDLSMDNLRGEAPDKYRDLRRWDFAKIRGKYEDIGDFFDDALKPLRVDIRKQCQEVAVRYSHLITNFLRQAAPREPQLAPQVLTFIRAKVSPRFEGVQYTLSESPLILLNLVDFLFIRVYYLQTD